MSNARELAELSGSYGTGGFVGMKNRIINGQMVIDQRNAGASVTNVNGGVYTLDRFLALGSSASKFTVQRNAGSVTPPAGYTNYLGVTSSSAYSITSSDNFAIIQRIEGFNIADFAWGTANAQPVTLSFWVRSSLTGTFGGSLHNDSYNRSYPFSYTISAANTWEQKSVTIAGDTSGSWNATSSFGISLQFGLGCGSTVSGTAGSWSGNYFLSATGATSVVGTSGATFYITGVQLEKGSTATSFDYRPYGTEFMLCQRYYQNSGSGAINNYPAFHYGTSGYTAILLPVTMRATPTVTATGLSTTWYEAGNSYTQALSNASGNTPQSITIIVAITGGTNGYAGTSYPIYQASAEL